MIAVLMTVTVGVAVATLTGASRSQSAFVRLRAATNASDISVFVGGAEDELREAQAALESTDGVLDTDVAIELFLRPAGTEYFPGFQLLALAPREARGTDQLDRPLILDGRDVDPTHEDEVALSEPLARELGAEVGDVLALESLTNDWTELSLNGGNPGAPDGPKVDATVVGIARSPADFSRLQAVLYLSPAFVERYGEEMRTYTILRAQVTPAVLRAAVAGEGLGGGLRGEDVRPSPFVDDASTEDGLGTIGGALRILAAAAALAGAVAIALASLHASRVALLDSAALRAVGFTRRQQVQTAVVILLPWLVAGVVAGVAAGILASPVALGGLARAADPSPDAIDVNVAVLAAVTGGALVAGLALLVLAGRLATTRRASRTQVAPPLFALRRPLPAVIGARNALFGSANRGGWTSRIPLGVAAVGVAAAVGALVVSASISRLQTDPTLTGQAAARVVGAEGIDTYDAVLDLLEGDERVALLAGFHVLFELEVDGRGGTNTLAIDRQHGDIGASIINGRVPSASDEVALGPASLDRIGKHVGDRVTMRGEAGDARLEIVGSVLFPEGDFSHDEGIAITAEAGDRLVGDVRSVGVHQVLFDWREGVDADVADQEMRDVGFEVLTNDTTLQPATVTNLGEVVALPQFLAAFLAQLALVTLLHAVTVALRTQSAELVTMRALGMTARGTAGVLSTHVAVLAGFALAAGLPLGLVIGRTVWRPIAEGAHVIVLAVWPSESILYLVGIGVLAAGVLATMAAWRVARLRPIELLRTE